MIRRAPEKTTAPALNARAQAFIRGGGSPSSRDQTGGAVHLVNLRIPAEILAGVDEAVRGRKVKTARHTWLLEAIVEKLEREGK